MALDVAASRAGSSAAVRRDSRHRLEASVDEWDRRRTLCMRSRRQELGPALRPRRGRQQCRCSSRTRLRKRRRRRGRIAGRALAAPRPRRSECHPRRIAGVAARQGLLLHADSHYVDPVSSRQRVPAPTSLAEHAYTAVGPARHTCCLLCTSSIQTVSYAPGKTRTSRTSAS